MRGAILAGWCAVVGVACGPPPPLSAQEVLRDRSPGTPLTSTPGLARGAEARFGDTVVRVESSSLIDKPRDLTRESVMDALALVASSAAEIQSVAGDVSAAAEALKSPRVTVSSRDGSVSAEARAKLPVDKQADAVKKGADDIAKVASIVEGAAALALALGALLGKEDEKVFVRIAAETRGVPHRATCSIKDEGDAKMPRSSVSCVIARADHAPRVVWHLDLGTQHATTVGPGEMLPASRGYLRPEPKAAGLSPLWISRPDKSVPFIRRALTDYASFAVQREAVAVARMRVDDGRSGNVWIAAGGVDDETRDAVSVALAAMALVRWPSVQTSDAPPPN
jgi:hypothetical protein